MRKHNPADNGVHLPFEDRIFTDAWAEWLEYRRERRLPKYVPKGLKKTFTKLHTDAGGDVNVAVEMINYSMSQNYQGLFKEKKNGTYQQSNTGGDQPKTGTSSAQVAALTKLRGEVLKSVAGAED